VALTVSLAPSEPGLVPKSTRESAGSLVAQLIVAVPSPPTSCATLEIAGAVSSTA